MNNMDLLDTVFTVVPVIGIVDHVDMRGVSTTMQHWVANAHHVTGTIVVFNGMTVHIAAAGTWSRAAFWIGARSQCPLLQLLVN